MSSRLYFSERCVRRFRSVTGSLHMTTVSIKLTTDITVPCFLNSPTLKRLQIPTGLATVHWVASGRVHTVFRKPLMMYSTSSDQIQTSHPDACKYVHFHEVFGVASNISCFTITASIVKWHRRMGTDLLWTCGVLVHNRITWACLSRCFWKSVVPNSHVERYAPVPNYIMVDKPTSIDSFSALNSRVFTTFYRSPLVYPCINQLNHLIKPPQHSLPHLL